jgi:hypothetical protein
LPDDSLCGGAKISRTSVITEALPGVQDLIFRNAGQRGEIGNAAQSLVVIRDHTGDLSLLEHALGDEDGVGVARVPPGKVAAVFTIPAPKTAMKRANVFW